MLLSPDIAKELTSKYHIIPEALKTRLVGASYPVPDFGILDPDRLKGYSVAVVTTHGPELPELDIPLTYLKAEGAMVDIVNWTNVGCLTQGGYQDKSVQLCLPSLDVTNIANQDY